MMKKADPAFRSPAFRLEIAVNEALSSTSYDPKASKPDSRRLRLIMALVGVTLTVASERLIKPPQTLRTAPAAYRCALADELVEQLPESLKPAFVKCLAVLRESVYSSDRDFHTGGKEQLPWFERVRDLENEREAWAEERRRQEASLAGAVDEAAKLRDSVQLIKKEMLEQRQRHGAQVEELQARLKASEGALEKKAEEVEQLHSFMEKLTSDPDKDKGPKQREQNAIRMRLEIFKAQARGEELAGQLEEARAQIARMDRERDGLIPRSQLEFAFHEIEKLEGKCVLLERSYEAAVREMKEVDVRHKDVQAELQRQIKLLLARQAPQPVTLPPPGPATAG
eukprot:tig00021126_g18466.t1